jgi:hypothetical protein
MKTKKLKTLTSQLMIAVSLFGIFLKSGSAVADESCHSDKPKNVASDVYAKFTSLAGIWMDAEDSSSLSRFEVLSGGTVVVEYIAGMINMIHLDKDQIRITHYCSAGNQPTFIATPSLPLVDFKLERVTNLLDGEGYISDVDYEFIDNDNIRESWIYKNPDGTESPHIFNLVRKKN